MRRVLLAVLVITTPMAVWAFAAHSRTGKSTPDEDSEFLGGASTIELFRSSGELQPKYRLQLNPFERDAVVRWIRSRTDDGAPEGLQKHVLMPKHLHLVVDGKFVSGFSPGWRGEEAIARVLPEIPAAADALRAAESLDWWRARFDRAAEPEREKQLAMSRARLERVLTAVEVAKVKSEHPGGDGDLEFVAAVAGLVRQGDDALRWSREEGAFIRGKADQPLFSRFKKGP